MTLRSIPELLDDVRSSEHKTSAHAGRELLSRHHECDAHAESIAQLLLHDNAAIADIVYRTLERVGTPILEPLLRNLPGTTGVARSYYLSLIASWCDDATLHRIFESEPSSDDDGRRFHAANCIGRRLSKDAALHADGRVLLDRAIALLETARSGKLRVVYWSQARMTLRTLGLLD